LKIYINLITEGKEMKKIIMVVFFVCLAVITAEATLSSKKQTYIDYQNLTKNGKSWILLKLPNGLLVKQTKKMRRKIKMKNKILNLITFLSVFCFFSSANAATPLHRSAAVNPSSVPIANSGDLVPGNEMMTPGNQAWVIQRIYAVCLEKNWRHLTISEESGENLIKVMCQDEEDGYEYTVIGCMSKGVLRVCLQVTDDHLNKDSQIFCDSFQKDKSGKFTWVRVNSIVPKLAEEKED